MSSDKPHGSFQCSCLTRTLRGGAYISMLEKWLCGQMMVCRSGFWSVRIGTSNKMLDSPADLLHFLGACSPSGTSSVKLAEGMA